jgi:hypothetical protein
MFTGRIIKRAFQLGNKKQEKNKKNKKNKKNRKNKKKTGFVINF